MKKSRFSEEQIIGILREVRRGGSTRAVCAAHKISEETYYAGKCKDERNECERGSAFTGVGG